MTSIFITQIANIFPDPQLTLDLIENANKLTNSNAKKSSFKSVEKSMEVYLD